jgi:hypothetical protein
MYVCAVDNYPIISGAEGESRWVQARQRKLGLLNENEDGDDDMVELANDAERRDAEFEQTENERTEDSTSAPAG